MDSDRLLQVIKRDCPLCNYIHDIEKRARITQAIYNNGVFEYEELYFLCPITLEEENEFVSGGLLDENLSRARDAYYRKYGTS